MLTLTIVIWVFISAVGIAVLLPMLSIGGTSFDGYSSHELVVLCIFWPFVLMYSFATGMKSMYTRFRRRTDKQAAEHKMYTYEEMMALKKRRIFAEYQD